MKCKQVESQRRGRCISVSRKAEWCVTQFATSKVGDVLVNLNPAYRLHELEYTLKQSGCSVLITAAQFKSSNYTEMLYDLASELRDCEPGSLKSATFPELTTVVRRAEEKVPGMFTWNELMVMGSDVSDEGLASIQLEQQSSTASMKTA